ncbi:MAG: DNA-binding response regulator [Verrucomicrobia bacterium]|nr:MAG: DNA-binding response regulator [Verrucomicrobiota bacterium]
MRILLADDHRLLRQGLKQILAEEFPEAEFAETGTTRETLERVRQQAWDVVLLDIFMPGRNGLEVLDEIRQSDKPSPVLVISSAPEEQMARRVLKAGASGYLNKQAAVEHLIQAVKKIATGGRYVSDAMAERLAAEVGRTGGLPHERLSGREFQVMQMIVSGKSLKEIAAELSLSVKTISTFHTRIWEKLGVKNDIELVRYAIEHRLEENSSA